MLSLFSSTIEKIIQDKKNLPEEIVAELKRNQLRAVICISANRCFVHDRLNDIFPHYMSEYKSYTLSSFGDWIENMAIPDLDREIQ